MTLYNRVKQKIIQSADLKRRGEWNGVPLPFPKLSDYVPSWDKGMSIGILGNTGSGKSFLTRYLFIYELYKFYKSSGYELRVLFFPLEDNKEKIYKFVLLNYLYEEHGIVLSLKELDSRCDNVLSDHIIKVLNQSDEYFADFEKIFTMIDGEHTPSGLYNHCRSFALKNGRVTKEIIDIDGEKVPQFTYHSDLHVFAVFDNMSNLAVDDECKTERDAMIKFCKIYAREKLCNFFNWTVIQVIQADFQTERQQYTTGGETIVSKLEPGLSSIGEAKTISRSMHLVLSIFDPNRYDIQKFPKPPKTDEHNCYDISILKSRFRSLKVIKNNDGDMGMRVPLLFDAFTGTFKELPLPKSNELAMVYRDFLGRPSDFSKQKNIILTNHEHKAFPF